MKEYKIGDLLWGKIIEETVDGWIVIADRQEFFLPISEFSYYLNAIRWPSEKKEMINSWYEFELILKEENMNVVSRKALQRLPKKLVEKCMQTFNTTIEKEIESIENNFLENKTQTNSSSARNTFDHEVSIMSALRGGQGDNFGF